MRLLTGVLQSTSLYRENYWKRTSPLVISKKFCWTKVNSGVIQKLRHAKLLNINILELPDTLTYVICVRTM